MQPGSIVAYFKVPAESGKIHEFSPAIVLGVTDTPELRGTDNEPALNLAVFNPAKAQLLGGPDWHLAYDRRSVVLHASHDEVQAEKHREYYVEAEIYVGFALPLAEIAADPAVTEIANAPTPLPTLAPQTPGAASGNFTPSSSVDTEPQSPASDSLSASDAAELAALSGTGGLATSKGESLAGTSVSSPATEPSPTTEAEESKSSASAEVLARDAKIEAAEEQLEKEVEQHISEHPYAKFFDVPAVGAGEQQAAEQSASSETPEILDALKRYLDRRYPSGVIDLF